MTKEELKKFLKSLMHHVDDLYDAENEEERLKYYERLKDLLKIED